MKTFTAIYKGNRIIELNESLELAENTVVLVVIPEQADLASSKRGVTYRTSYIGFTPQRILGAVQVVPADTRQVARVSEKPTRF